MVDWLETHRAVTLPSTNADGKPIVPMTDEQKYTFDLKGWLCLPGLLSDDQVGEVREHLMKVARDRESLPPEQRHIFGGPGQILLDHPVLVGVLNEITAHASMSSEECYGFRFDGAFLSLREAGHDNWSPHGGSGLYALCGNSHLYQAFPGRVHAGLTRCVWEINEVAEGDGGTRLLSGSHKAAFKRPAFTNERDCPLWETYTCPPGSVMVFTEALCHTGTTWTNEQRQRLSVFCCYNTIGAKWHADCPPAEVIAAMPPKRQSLFRGVWTGAGEGKGANRYLDESNWARFRPE